MSLLEALAMGALLVTPAPSQAHSTQSDEPVRSAVAVATRAERAPEINGLDTDPVWQRAPLIGDFRQFDPQPGAEPSFRTEFRAAYDDRNLYVYGRAHGPHPDSIMRALSRRGVRGPSDQLGIIVGSYNDGRTGVQFAVNPDGVKRDFAVYDDTREDGSWNGIWDVATVVDSLGWAAEFRIPLSQLRYPEAESHTFEFGVWRDIERYNERAGWPLFSRTASGFMSQTGALEGLDGITSARPLEPTLYAVTKSVPRGRTGGGFERTQEVAVGGDVRYGISPNVTLNATINPDFGQVEADPAVLNLTAFETFLSERRPFFVEGMGQYEFQLNCYIVVHCSTNEGLFYSRRIGRTPSLRGTHGDATTPTATPIAAAAKVTGRTRAGLSFGILDAVTPRVEGVEGRTVEPLTNHAVLRAQQDLRDGDAGLTAIFTAVNRDLDEWTAPMLHSSAYVTGISFRNRFGGGDYEVAGSLTASRVAGSEEAMKRTQRSPVRYFQQPGNDHEVDPTRTSLAGHAQQVKVGKYGGGITRFETSFVRQSAGFEVNGNHWQRWNTSGTRLETAFNTNAHMGLHNNWGLHAGATVEGVGETYCDRCTRGGPLVRRSPGLHPWFGVNVDNRRTVAPSVPALRTATTVRSGSATSKARTASRITASRGWISGPSP